MKEIYLSFDELRPSQIVVSEKKLTNATEHINSIGSAYKPLPVRKHNDKYVLTDGHARALALYIKGDDKVKVVIDEESIDERFYNKCLELCEKQELTSISKLKDKVVDHDVYMAIWDENCVCLYDEIKLDQTL